MSDTFRSDKLRLARLFHGKSLQELGEVLSTSRQYIQQLENGSKFPSHDMILALAAALNVEPGFFATPSENFVSEEQCHFRSLKTTSASIKLQALAHGTFFDRLAQFLDETLDLPPINFPKLKHEIKDANDIERAAEKCRIEWGLGMKTPIKNMIRVLENAGALVTYFNGVSEKIDAFSMQRRRPLIIRNSSKQSICRMRFDLAHECGHIVMHEGIETGDNKTEGEANRFASAFLLPRTAFLNEFKFLEKMVRIPWQSIYELKIRWKVSVSAIIRRAYDLELIDAIKYRNAYIHLRKTGQTKIETNDNKIDDEKPEVLHAAIEVFKSDNNNLVPILRHLKVRPEFFKKIVGDIHFKQEDFYQK